MLSQDTIVLPASEGRWIVINVFARTAIGVETAGLSRISEGGAGNKVLDSSFSVWEISRFSNLDGLLADPTRIVRSVEEWPEAEILDDEDFCRRMRDRCIIIEDLETYKERFGPKTSPLDRRNFGSFHQQLGQELLLRRREVPEDWWLAQKFTDDFSALKETLYKAGEGAYLQSYFRDRFRKGMRVLDVGCGPGFYARWIAESGADVVGVDPNPGYIDHANGIGAPGAQFITAPVGSAGALDMIEDASIDVVFISDALLFYFSPPVPELRPDIDVLFKDIRRVLRDTGKLVSVEPHHSFWLQPWLGDIDRPFTIMTEYRDKKYGVTPTVAEFIGMFSQQGFAVSWMDEIYASVGAADIDERALNFASEFPIGQIYELRLMPESWQ